MNTLLITNNVEQDTRNMWTNPKQYATKRAHRSRAAINVNEINISPKKKDVEEDVMLLHFLAEHRTNMKSKNNRSKK